MEIMYVSKLPVDYWLLMVILKLKLSKLLRSDQEHK
jgi:hypothetical protein